VIFIIHSLCFAGQECFVYEFFVVHNLYSCGSKVYFLFYFFMRNSLGSYSGANSSIYLLRELTNLPSIGPSWKPSPSTIL